MPSEVEVAARLIEVMDSRGFDTYQEVPLESWGHTADIVATHNNHLTVVEVKVRPCFAVFKQASYWRRRDWANAVYVAYLVGPRYNASRWHDLAKTYKVGVVGIGEKVETLVVAPSAGLDHRLIERARKLLIPQRKGQKCAAGSVGGVFTEFQRSVEALEVYLREHGPTKVSTLMDSVDHHWSNGSAGASCLARYIRVGVITSIVKVDRGIYQLAEEV